MTGNGHATPTRTPAQDAPRSPASGAATWDVLVVEERRPIAQSLAATLADQATTVTTLVEPGLDGSVPAPATPHGGVALLDAGIGAPGDAPALTRALAAAGWSVLVLSRPGDLLTPAACLEAGAALRFAADASLADIVDAVSALRAGRPLAGADHEHAALLAMLRAARTESARARRPFQHLTPRERQVLGALMDGHRASQIAETGFVSVTTVRNQIQAVLTKLGVSSQLEAVALARRAGWSPENDDT
jgi:DNA-binding NarL/FixJ family response regulator